MSEQSSGSGQAVYYAGLAGVIVVIIVAFWLLFSGDKEQVAPAPLPQIVQLPVPEAAPEAVASPEVPELETPNVESAQVITESEPVVLEKSAPALPPLPALNESDSALSTDLLALNWKAGLAALFNREEMIRHFVVTVDNVAQGQLVAGQPVLVKPASGYQVEEIAQNRFKMAGSNSQRYEPYIQLLESVPARQLLALKQRYQPLLEEAFAELGYPELTFDQRLRQAIALLLATPSAPTNAELIRPSVMYTYADERLEGLPEAQKQVLRLSPEQQQRFKALLATYQQALGN
ncbi:hypothetical protein GCM10010919_11160 [Alishewanella longhuensis]|uniref:DUF3014 domain-containing protein n=1 Tax=Alishewanella longhuensis TaxID=1091037 RepID=A0ABQ3KWV8_9ALTE|nr:DUF3014 domain-containing protein [Alishewanella longhuensis]GHG64541.1 hypothetical protein GCM10010919_11160 [Alishewanella longhuensis]